MILLRIPNDCLNKRIWISEILLSRLSADYKIIPESRTTWRIEVENYEMHLEFDDQIIPTICSDRSTSVRDVTYWNDDITKELDLNGLPILSLNQCNFRYANDIRPDIFGMSFWALSLWEEFYSTAENDRFNRSKFISSYLHKYDLIYRPWVDEWVLWLKKIIESWDVDIKLKIWRPKFELSHDVDVPFVFAFSGLKSLISRIGGDLFKRKNLISPITTPIKWVLVKCGMDSMDPMYTFDWIMINSEKMGLKTTFYFIAGNSAGNIDGDYSICNSRVKKLLKKIHDRGHLIGLHPSFNAYNNKEILTSEFNALKGICCEIGIHQDSWSSRQHFLRWDPCVTPLLLNTMGVSYDSTLSFAEHVGFRCGTSWEYNLYDLKNDKTMQLIEKPLIVMDVTVLNKFYMGLSTIQEIRSTIQKLKNATYKVGGVFTLLWHNNQLDTRFKRQCFLNSLDHAHPDW